MQVIVTPGVEAESAGNLFTQISALSTTTKKGVAYRVAASQLLASRDLTQNCSLLRSGSKYISWADSQIIDNKLITVRSLHSLATYGHVFNGKSGLLPGLGSSVMMLSVCLNVAGSFHL